MATRPPQVAQAAADEKGDHDAGSVIRNKGTMGTPVPGDNAGDDARGGALHQSGRGLGVPAVFPYVQNDAAGPGQVMAQGIARPLRGDVAWTVRRIAAPGGEGAAVEAFPHGFIVAGGGCGAGRSRQSGIGRRTPDIRRPTSDVGWRGGAAMGNRGISSLWRVLALVACLFALGMLAAIPGAAAEHATPATDQLQVAVPLSIIAAGEGTNPAAGGELVWLVRRGAASGDQRAAAGTFPAGFALAHRGRLSLLGADDRLMAELRPGQAAFLPGGTRGALASASGDLVLFIQIALVRAAEATGELPPAMSASEPFAAPSDAQLRLELARGIVNPGRISGLPASSTPALLMTVDGAVRVQHDGQEVIEVGRGQMLLLVGDETVSNPGAQPVLFVLARVLPALASGDAAQDTSGSNQLLPARSQIDPEARRRLVPQRLPPQPRQPGLCDRRRRRRVHHHARGCRLRRRQRRR